jgi:1-acyl-sn-glycerol-3-phosphate acyltransferase
MRSDNLPRISPRLFALFAAYGERYVARSFHAVRLSQMDRPDPEDFRGKPLVVYLNHPSWWDPMMCLLLATRLFPDRRHYGPIEGSALEKYRFFTRLGFFGVDGTVQGVRRFLDVGRRILEQPDATLWITAQGRFTDPRQRPVELRPGLGRLLAGSKVEGNVLPLALEYPFWDERFPEALARFGRSIPVSPEGAEGAEAMSTMDWTHVLGGRLQATQNGLASDALSRDPSRFEVLNKGPVGVGLSYDLWRRFRARLRGERFRAGHGIEEARP